MKIKDGFELTEIRPGLYVAKAVGERAKEFPQGIQMGLSGAVLWDMMSRRDCTSAELIFHLDGLFEEELEPQQIAADVEVFLCFLRENSLLEGE